MSIYTKIFIKRCIKADSSRDAGLTTPDEINRFDNILYGNDPKWQILDVYRPKNSNEKLPVIVSVHGGGWVYGDKEVYQYYCMDLAKRGFVVVNFTYRLAPKHKFPAGLEDTNSVFTWIVQHSDEYGMDMNNIFALGDSAGATNIGLYAATLANSNYAKEYSFMLPDIKIKALGLNCGVYDMTKPENNGFKRDLFKNKGTDEELNRITLLNHITKNYPPCYIIGASNDSLKEDIPPFKKVLDDNNIVYSVKIYGDENNNPLYHVFHCNVRSSDAKEANDDECNFFKQYIQ